MKMKKIGSKLEKALKNTSLNESRKFFDGIEIIYRENNSEHIEKIIVNMDYIISNNEEILEIYTNGKYGEWSMKNPCAYGLFKICRDTDVLLKFTEEALILDIDSIFLMNE